MASEKYPGWPKLPALEAMATKLEQARETIARLERERDEARRELAFYRTTEKGQIKADLDAARADAARMRLFAIRHFNRKGWREQWTCKLCESYSVISEAEIKHESACPLGTHDVFGSNYDRHVREAGVTEDEKVAALEWARAEGERWEVAGSADRWQERALHTLLDTANAERDAARADAARMRRVLLSIERTEIGGLTRCPACGKGLGLPHGPSCELDAALTPDDGWLASKLAEAVEPYRAFVEAIVRDGHTDACSDAWAAGCVCLFASARALLGGTPTKADA